ncbi:tetratricopeptide repeat protein [Ekhidna sp.]
MFKQLAKQGLILFFLFFLSLTFVRGQDDRLNTVIDSLINQSRKTFRSDPFAALNNATQASQLASSLETKHSLGHALKMQANINYVLGNYPLALDLFLQAQQAFENQGDSINMIGVIASSGLVHKSTNNFKKAIEIYNYAFEKAEAAGATDLMAKIINNKGVVLRKIGDYEAAERSFLISLRLKKKLGNEKGVANSLTNLGNVMADQEEYDQSLSYFKQALEKEQELESKEGMAMNLNNMANLYLRINNLDEAISFAKKGLAIAEQLTTKIQIKEASKVLSDAYAMKNNYELAFDYYQKYTVAKDSLFNEDEAREIGRLESKLELIRKEIEVEKLNRENELKELKIRQERAQQQLFVIVALLLVGILVYVLITQRQKSNLREQLLKSEVAELRSEIKELIVKHETNLDIPLESLNEKLIHPLSEREYDVFKLIFSQKTNSEIANELFVSINTVKTHLKNLYSKLGVSNRKEALSVVLDTN